MQEDLKARRRMLGNIQFIGELFKEKMLTEKIMHECIVKLLGEASPVGPITNTADTDRLPGSAFPRPTAGPGQMLPAQLVAPACDEAYLVSSCKLAFAIATECTLSSHHFA